ncbi:uncharacterized protein LOC143265297 [Megachile rotundata]|uniref:uncharacterized protein LOC143265297 n=1 Tax=Megachile rotundata TaxID=143995 RepID=UPI003FD4CEF4
METTKNHQGNGAAENAGASTIKSTDKNQASTSKSTNSYANATKSESFPTKDQAIILSAIDGTTIKEYACAVGKLIGPKAIKYISRISNNRICIYLDKKETVTTLTKNHKSIEINNTKIEIRPMITPAERIIFSNVSPVIPNKSIEDILKRNNIRICSRITPLKAGMTDPEYAHILSFRRQIYVNPEDAKMIPDSFVINFEDTAYRIFTTTDKLNCFHCKQEGHIAKQCPHNIETSERDIITDSTSTTDERIVTSQTPVTTPKSTINYKDTLDTEPIKTTNIPCTPILTTETQTNKETVMETEPTEVTENTIRNKRPLSDTSSEITTKTGDPEETSIKTATPVIISKKSTDLNSHNTLWGSSKNDLRGSKIGTILENDDITLLNTNHHTHFNSTNGTFSCIDLTFSSTNYAHNLDWTIMEDLNDSDHFPISIQVKTLPSTHNVYTPSPKWNFKKANWELYKDRISVLIKQSNILDNMNDINSTIEILSNIIIEAANEAIGTSLPPKKRNPVPWWNDRCKEALRNSKRAFNRLKRHFSEENLIQFKKLRATVRKIIKESKINGWTNYFSTLTGNTNIKEIWNKINAMRRNKKTSRAPILICNSNSIISDPQEIANTLASSFAKNSSSENYSDDFRQLKEIQEGKTTAEITNSHGSYLNTPISISELKEVLKTIKNSSPGPDNIPNKLIKNLPEIGIQTLLFIYNIIWENNIFPKKWNEAIVIPVPKPGKDLTKANSYRPIALTCNLCKILEKIINARLKWFLEHNKLISSNQFGFRAGHSTTSHLVSLETHIREAFANNQHALVSLDIEKAYDMVWRHQILNNLKEIAVTGNMWHFVKNFINNRTIQVRYNGTLSQKTEIENGVPQGSILSVTLFLLAINDVGKISRMPVITSIFADDITILCKGSLLIPANISSKWPSTNSMNGQIKMHHESRTPTLKLGTNILKFVTCTKILGVLFDSKLTWKNHIEYLINSCKQRLKPIKSISHNNWGADKTVLLQTYRAIIRSKIDYASVIYNSAKANIIKKLDTIHNAGLRIVTGAFHTTPIGSLLIEAGETSLVHRRKLLSLKYAIRALTSTNPIIHADIFSKVTDQSHYQTGNLPPHQRLKNYLKELQFKLPNMEKTRLHKIPPWTLQTPEIDTTLEIYRKENLSKKRFKQIFNALCSNYPDFTHIYTDGSKNNHGTGAAVFTQEETCSYGLHPYNSIYTAETYAILSALNLINRSSRSKFIIFSDSLSTIRKTQDLRYATERHLEIQEKYNKLIKDNKTIIIAWVPYHMDIYGNTMADLQAKIATTTITENQPTLNTSADINRHVATLLEQLWNSTWKKYKASAVHQQLNKFYDLKTNPRHNRRYQVAITRIRTEHTKLTHSYILENVPPRKCDTCDTNITIRHIILECRKYNDARRRLNITTNLTEAATSTSYQDSLLKFCKTIGILSQL